MIIWSLLLALDVCGLEYQPALDVHVLWKKKHSLDEIGKAEKKKKKNCDFHFSASIHAGPLDVGTRGPCSVKKPLLAKGLLNRPVYLQDEIWKAREYSWDLPLLFSLSPIRRYVRLC